MDGTLTIPQHNFNEIRQLLGIETGADILEAIEEMPLEKRLSSKEKLHKWEHSIALKSIANLDAIALVRSLHQKGYALGVLTRNNSDLAHITLESSGFSPYFDKQTVLGRDSAPPKPAPDGIYKICQHWDIPPKDTVMVGDYILDTQAGRRAGCTTVLIDANHRFGHQPCTDFHVHSIAELGRPVHSITTFTSFEGASRT